MARCWKSRRASKPRDSAPSAQVKLLGLLTSNRATLILPARPSLCQGSMELVCCWQGERTGRGRHGWRPCGGGHHAALSPVTRRMKTASSSVWSRSAGETASSMSPDRGYCSSLWLGALRGFQARFILRWKTNYHLVNAAGIKQAAWKIARGKVGLAPRTIWDAVHHRNVEGRVLFFCVTHPDFPDWPLTLVVGRRKGGKPWYAAHQRGRQNGRRCLESRAGLRTSLAD